MSTESTAGTRGTWETLASHDWSETQAIEMTLSAALEHLDSGADETLLYDYIDLEAVVNAFDPETTQRGASEVRFRYEDYQIRITHDGTIAARELPEATRLRQ